jgi:nitrite reductase/ring-hydroxylating ferredoxin subunit
MPTGWFQIGWSTEFVKDEVRPLRYFRRDLVAYRGQSGGLHVLDGHCGHLGAHLGYGGRVAGDDVICPFHNWRWSCQGGTVDIPYSERKTQAKRIGVWDVREVDGFVFVWHDAAGAPPSWEPELPLTFPIDSYYPVYPQTARRHADVAMQPLLLTENLPDVFHFRYLHGTVRVPMFEKLDLIDHRIHSFQRFSDPIDLEGEAPPQAASGTFDVHAFGLGILLVNISGMGDVSQIACPTPIDHKSSDFHFTVLVPKDMPPRRIEAFVALQNKLAAEDFPIWEHLAYQERPPFTPEEAGPYRAVRKWARQFYPHEPAPAMGSTP